MNCAKSSSPIYNFRIHNLKFKFKTINESVKKLSRQDKAEL